MSLRPTSAVAITLLMQVRCVRALCALALGCGIAASGCHQRQLPEAPSAPAPAAAAPAAPLSQNPSPMVELARRHDRVPQEQSAGLAFKIDSVLARSVDVFIPDPPGPAGDSAPRTLLVHIFGASHVAMHAASSGAGRFVLAVINLGGSSSAYERALSEPGAWTRLLSRVREETSARTAGRVQIGRVVVSAFSAGYGGVRGLLGDERIAATIDGVVLLDGLHTGYIPERTVLAEGGVLDTLKLVSFLRYARRATAGDVAFLITHSEIFPGTFASTTETADWLIRSLGLARTPVLAWGPGGMQQLSEVRRGRLAILGFAGNTAPDHVDHLHGLGAFLAQIER